MSFAGPKYWLGGERQVLATLIHYQVEHEGKGATYTELGALTGLSNKLSEKLKFLQEAGIVKREKKRKGGRYFGDTQTLLKTVKFISMVNFFWGYPISFFSDVVEEYIKASRRLFLNEVCNHPDNKTSLIFTLPPDGSAKLEYDPQFYRIPGGLISCLRARFPHYI